MGAAGGGGEWGVVRIGADRGPREHYNQWLGGPKLVSVIGTYILPCLTRLCPWMISPYSPLMVSSGTILGVFPRIVLETNMFPSASGFMVVLAFLWINSYEFNAALKTDT